MPWQVIQSLFRHGLGLLGGALMSADLISATEADTLIGGAMAVLAIGWSIGRKWLRKRRTGSAA